jgi:Lon-like ATP-dependent protease
MIMEEKPVAQQDPKEKIDLLQKTSWEEFETTDQIKIPEKLIDQVIGQARAVDLVRKSAKQRRNILLIGEPGTGKSMLAAAMTELLPPEELIDVLAYPNLVDENNPRIGVVPAGEGIKVVKREREKLGETPQENRGSNMILPFLIVFGALGLYFFANMSDLVTAALIALAIFMFFLSGFSNMRLGMMGGGQKTNAPKLIIDNSGKKQAPFFDGTGAHSGALLGDVKHDPLQSGGLGTPPHLRVVPGLIHKANKGVLFVDEIATLGKSQQDLLTALQEKQLAITGRSEMSSGAMVMTDPVPCDFILIAAGNYTAIQQMHPALRSRIRGYGYEIYMDDMTDDTDEYRKLLAQFVAQEVFKDKKIPHFMKDAVGEIIREAKRKAGMRDKMTLKFRELGGLIRAAGDLALDKKHEYVTAEDVLEAKKKARTLEQQMGDVFLEKKKEYNVLITEGGRIGRVNGLAVLGDGGTVLPIEAEVAPGGKKAEIIATGKLGEIAQEAVKNVSAVIMKFYGEDIKEKYDIFVQFLQTYEGVEGDSASVSVAVAVISAFTNVPVDQSVAMTGSLTVRGEVLPVGGITQKIEAAIEAGLKKVIIPKANQQDVFLEQKYEGKIEIIPAETITDVLRNSLIGGEDVLKRMNGTA